MAALVVDSNSACTALRRGLGATSWFVLEELVIGAEMTERGVLRVRASTRALAVSLELNKDTVTRVLAKLRACGVITVVARGGATGASVFTINVPAGVVIAQSAVDVGVGVGTRRGKRRHTSGQDQAVTQLSLLT
jgi:hypothetical protein